MSTTTAIADSADTAKILLRIPLLPEHSALLGPVARKLVVRLGSTYAAILLTAFIASMTANNPVIEALALGAMLPGGGFLLWAGPECAGQIAHIVLALGCLGLFGTALVLWFATGNVLAPLVVWAFTAVAAAAMAYAHIDAVAWTAALHLVPIGILSLLVLLALGMQIAQVLARRQRQTLNAYLVSPAAQSLVVAEPKVARTAELSLEDLQLMRLLYDRALQPVDRFDGFDWRDQYQTASVRYQINFVSYALSVAGAVHLPAFEGYHGDAQRNLITKMQDHRVWGYWQLENLWGNLRRLPDPIPHDNIMFTGFLAAQIAYVQAISGARTYDQPGSLVFQHPSGVRYIYDQPALIEALMRGFRDSKFTLMACEPNWIYPVCNAMGATALRAYDAANGTALWDEIEAPFRDRLEREFVTPRGSLVVCRSGYTGLALPPIMGAITQAFPCFFLNALYPDLALRHWLIARRRLSRSGFNRELWPIDIGNYSVSRAASYTAAMAAAVEMGDSDLAQRLRAGFDEDCPITVADGVARRSNASLLAHTMEVMARTGQQNALRTLVTAKPMTARGPVIAAATYPDVLVAKAKATDGALDAVFYPGRDAGSQRLNFGGLVPGRRYRATGNNNADLEIHADASGAANIDRVLDGRTTLRLVPAIG